MPYDPKKVRAAIEKSGMTQTDVAIQMHIATSNFYRLIDVNSPPRDPQGSTLEKLANVLGVKIDDFFTPAPEGPSRPAKRKR